MGCCDSNNTECRDEKSGGPAGSFTLEVTGTKDKCPIGETVGERNSTGGKIPVISCEGACIRGEIARLAANLVAKEEPYRRGCHGELFTVPASTMAGWIKKAEKVVLIDGCFLRCHGRVLENLLGKEKLVQFDALSHYKKYTDLFDIDSVPEAERKAVARSVADWVLEGLRGQGNPKPSLPGNELKEETMSLESARKFVGKMREDKQFRSQVGSIETTQKLKEVLKSRGYDFDERDLVGAMAECMAGLDKLMEESG